MNRDSCLSDEGLILLGSLKREVAQNMPPGHGLGHRLCRPGHSTISTLQQIWSSPDTQNQCRARKEGISQGRSGVGSVCGRKCPGMFPQGVPRPLNMAAGLPVVSFNSVAPGECNHEPANPSTTNV